MVDAVVILPWDDSCTASEPGLATDRRPARRGRGGREQRSPEESLPARPGGRQCGRSAAADFVLLLGAGRAALDRGLGQRDRAGRHLECWVAAAAAALRRLAGRAGRSRPRGRRARGKSRSPDSPGRRDRGAAGRSGGPAEEWAVAHPQCFRAPRRTLWVLCADRPAWWREAGPDTGREGRA